MKHFVRCSRCYCKINIGYNGYHDFYTLSFDGKNEVYLCENCNEKPTLGQDDLVHLYKPAGGEK